MLLLRIHSNETTARPESGIVDQDLQVVEFGRAQPQALNIGAFAEVGAQDFDGYAVFSQELLGQPSSSQPIDAGCRFSVPGPSLEVIRQGIAAPRIRRGAAT